MFRRILVANRGEIAVRIMNTCRDMDIESVAVYSDADEKSLHVIRADRSVCIGDPRPSESYLNIDKIIKAALETGAEAIHPGYGFLAENPGLAEACEQNGITFIGPPPSVIRDLGDKTVARRIMIGNGVPVIPGMTGPAKDPGLLEKEAEKIGYPVMIKAAAGGGGRGMRIVRDPAELGEAAISASSEAEKAFSSGEIYLEKYIEEPRHVEFQVLGDSHGAVIHLFERECSVQRRHQKIIEESPSPALDPDLRERMGRAALNAASAAGYVNAGTVEFLLDAKGNFYFLEVNTRLQVEHPVTEMITGLDLVRHQVMIAAGEPLMLKQADVVPRGHALECRIYAEDPEKGFMPCPGRIDFMKDPSGPGVRVDSGIYSGCTVPVDYDPILSKVIVHSESRECSINRMINALSDYPVIGVETPISFLIDILDSEPFRQGDTCTDFIERVFPDWSPCNGHDIEACAAYIIRELAGGVKNDTGHEQARGIPTPWQTLGNWRM